MSGRFRATATVAASTGTNTSSPSHFRRRHTACAFSRPDTGCPTFCILHLPCQAVVTLRRGRACAVHLDRNAAPEHLNGEDEQSFVRPLPYQNTLHPPERPVSDADTMSFAQVRVGEHRDAGLQRRLNRLDLAVGNLRQAIPSLPQDTDEPPRLPHLDVARLIHSAAEEEVAWKHGDLDQ